MELNARALKILTTLGQDPTCTNQELAKACGISPVSAKKHLAALFANRVVLGVSSQVDNFAVGLKPIIVMAEVGPENWKTYEKSLDIHPYTKYRIRCFGNCIGIFSLFAIPPHSDQRIIGFLERMKEKQIVQEYKLVTPITNIVTVETNFDYYDPEKEWLFDWKKWEKSLVNTEPQSLNGPARSVLHRLDSADMRILRQLSKDSRRKSRKIAEDAEVEPYHLSRRRKVMEKLGVIQGYRVLAGMHLLQLTSHAIIKCKCSIDTTYKVAAAVKLLPFQSTFIQTLEGFVLYTTTTAIDFPILATILLEQCDSAEISWCDYRSSFRYWFYDKPYADGEWNASHDYMVDAVISELEDYRRSANQKI